MVHGIHHKHQHYRIPYELLVWDRFITRFLEEFTIINVSRYKHLSCISHFKQFDRKFKYPTTCVKHFKSIKELKRHMPACPRLTRRYFPGAFHKQPRTLQQKLKSLTSNIPGHTNPKYFINIEMITYLNALQSLSYHLNKNKISDILAKRWWSNNPLEWWW